MHCAVYRFVHVLWITENNKNASLLKKLSILSSMYDWETSNFYYIVNGDNTQNRCPIIASSFFLSCLFSC